MKRVSFAGTVNLGYTADDPVNLHVPSALTASGLSYIPATIQYIQITKNSCDGVLYRYFVEYNPVELLDPSTALTCADIIGMTYNSVFYSRYGAYRVSVVEEFILTPSEMFYARMDPAPLNSQFTIPCRDNT